MVISTRVKEKLSGVDIAKKCDYTWLGECESNRGSKKKKYYTGFEYGGIQYYQGDCVLVRTGFSHDDYIENYDIARINKCFDNGALHDSGKVAVQWYTQIGKISRHHMKNLPDDVPALDGDFDVAKDYWVVNDEIDIECITNKCCIVESNAYTIPHSVKRPKDVYGVLFVCRFKFVREKPCLRPLLLEDHHSALAESKQSPIVGSPKTPRLRVNPERISLSHNKENSSMSKRVRENSALKRSISKKIKVDDTAEKKNILGCSNTLNRQDAKTNLLSNKLTKSVNLSKKVKRKLLDTEFGTENAVKRTKNYENFKTSIVEDVTKIDDVKDTAKENQKTKAIKDIGKYRSLKLNEIDHLLSDDDDNDNNDNDSSSDDESEDEIIVKGLEKKDICKSPFKNRSNTQGNESSPSKTKLNSKVSSVKKAIFDSDDEDISSSDRPIRKIKPTLKMQDSSSILSPFRNKISASPFKNRSTASPIKNKLSASPSKNSTVSATGKMDSDMDDIFKDRPVRNSKPTMKMREFSLSTSSKKMKPVSEAKTKIETSERPLKNKTVTIDSSDEFEENVKVKNGKKVMGSSTKLQLSLCRVDESSGSEEYPRKRRSSVVESKPAPPRKLSSRSKKVLELESSSDSEDSIPRKRRASKIKTKPTPTRKLSRSRKVESEFEESTDSDSSIQSTKKISRLSKKVTSSNSKSKPTLKKLQKLEIPNRKKPINECKTDFEMARLKLHVSAVPNCLPCREEEFHQIYSFVEGKLLDGTGGCMYVSGVPGTGKTATVREVVKLLNDSLEDSSISPFDFIEINAMKLTKPHQLWVQIWEKLTGQRCTADHASNLLEKYLTNEAPRKKSIFLLMDELDLLWTRKQDVMYNLFDWSSRIGSKLVVIAIANTMDLPERIMMSRVQSRLGLTRMTFHPYTFQQLQEIIQSRLRGIEAFDSDAVQLVSRKVAAVSGDARRALDICRRATEIAENCQLDISKSPFKSPSKKNAGQVTMMHVSEAIGEMFSSPKIVAVKGCSYFEKMLLEAIRMEFERTGVEEAVLIRVISHTKEICYLEGNTPPNDCDIFRLLSSLSSQKIVLIDNFRADLYLKIRLNMSIDDIKYALGS